MKIRNVSLWRAGRIGRPAWVLHLRVFLPFFLSRTDGSSARRNVRERLACTLPCRPAPSTTSPRVPLHDFFPPLPSSILSAPCLRCLPFRCSSCSCLSFLTSMPSTSFSRTYFSPPSSSSSLLSSSSSLSSAHYFASLRPCLPLLPACSFLPLLVILTPLSDCLPSCCPLPVCCLSFATSVAIAMLLFHLTPPRRLHKILERERRCCRRAVDWLLPA